jgi:hypothetical protein
MRRSTVLLFSLLLLALSLTLVTAHAQAQALDAALVSQYPTGSIQSVAQASAALADVTTTRQHVEESYTEARRVCLEKFFMSACFNRAKESRRTALAAIRKVEVEASAFLRKDKADELDRGVAERQRKAASSTQATVIPFVGATRTEPETVDKP